MSYTLKYTLKRILLMLLTLFLILSLTFFLIKMLPDSAMAGMKPQQYAYCNDQVSKGFFVVSDIERFDLGNPVLTYQDDITGAIKYFYRRPVILQYGSWLQGIFTRWDWGESTAYAPGRTAINIISSSLKPTVLVNLISLLFTLPFGFLFGIWAALKKDKPTDYIISTLVMVFISVPSFITITLLLSWFGFDLKWLPTRWPDAGAPAGEVVRGYIIPVLSLGFGTVAGFTRYTRAELTEVMSSDFLLLARTKGLSKTQCVVRHALRNSMVPIIPMVIGEFISILSGSIVLEGIYAIPGIGSLFIDCINLKDYELLLADMAVFTTINLVANLLVDLSYGLVDPRIRMGAKAK
jgi:oligopeptide transport system permease protein